MTADLRLIMNSAKCNTHILASESPCHRLSKAGLTHSRRAVKTEDRRLHVTLEFQHRKILDNSFLDLLQAIVVFIKHLLSMLEVKVVIRNDAPWQIEHELDVVVLYAVIRRRRIISLQFGHLLFKYLLNRSRPELLLGTRTQL